MTHRLGRSPSPLPATRRRTALLALAAWAVAGCQTVPPAAPPRPSFSPEQVRTLQGLGFRPEGDDWQLDLSMALLFEFDADRLAPLQIERLGRLGRELAEAGIHRMHVEGHTDNVGAASYNQALSLRRAASVARALSGAGFDAAGLQVRGLGAARPIADNTNEAGRARNRRVTLIVVAD
ncbi:OmpA family protein [Rubrivivax benzoatilyticus]|uniref:OmpA family protein n=1 Tax=Rubrivivax benzoatilyticus TaxID=316997 RepID=A0ABX0HQ01_9BURK|nr:OmpA family protein [Rubrivivax benzoatilyticus]EGJ08731.1 outer membrane protein, ompa family [Rubrivivax benzoatilyticus JA2 = ATCC BAA-35]MCD0418742.1 OmpA family protein [Rubrivivax sp. JA1024]NHK97148.1 OmpA family protein [Rubrivivax benzoatilyticus]NHL23157.1 OmpA family protein [Rubrivivax benzoatilyticus]